MPRLADRPTRLSPRPRVCSDVFAPILAKCEGYEYTKEAHGEGDSAPTIAPSREGVSEASQKFLCPAARPVPCTRGTHGHPDKRTEDNAPGGLFKEIEGGKGRR